MSKNKLNKPKSSDSYQGQVTQSQNNADIKTFTTVFFYCIIIILLPVISFFASKCLFDTFDLSSTTAYIYSAVVAVVSLHLALFLYLYRAYSGGDTQPTKQD